MHSSSSSFSGSIGVVDELNDEVSQDFEKILSQTTALLAQRGDEEAVALLVDVQATELVDTDEVARTEERMAWDVPIKATIYRRELLLDVEEHLIPRFTNEVLERITEVLAYVSQRHGYRDVAYVRPRMALPPVDGNWRETFLQKLQTDQPSNQARREVSGQNHPVADGMTFGSPQERTVYFALKDLQSRARPDDTIAIFPLPSARLREGHTWSPDFVVLGRGRAFILEVDGPHHRAKRRVADDHNRDLQWRRCGVPVVRIPVEDLRNPQELQSRLAEEIKRNLPRS